MRQGKKICNIEIFSQKLLENYEFCHTYSFSGTSNISLKISENSFYVSYKITTNPSSFNSNYFYDAIRKVYILHLIIFSKPINLDNVRLTIETDTKVLPENTEPLLYSLVNEEFSKPRRIPESWQNDGFIKKLLNTSESDYDARFSALFALLVSKSKEYEIERFQNLWIAMNGLYGFYANKMAKGILENKGKNDKLQNYKEYKELRLLQFFVESKVAVIKKEDRNYLAKEIKTILNSVILNSGDCKEVISKEEFLSEKYEELRTKIKAKFSEKNIEISEYAYLIIYYAYYQRCNIFHADKPLPLIYFNQKKEWRIIRFVNDLIEDFLDNNLYKFFLDDFIDKEKIKIVRNKQFLKGKLRR